MPLPPSASPANVRPDVRKDAQSRQRNAAWRDHHPARGCPMRDSAGKTRVNPGVHPLICAWHSGTKMIQSILLRPRATLNKSQRMRASEIGMGCKAQYADGPGGPARLCNAADRPMSGCTRREGLVQRCPRGLRGRRHRSETRGKRAQLGSAFEDCGRSHSRKNGDEVGLFSTRCSRCRSAAQAPGPFQPRTGQRYPA